jgi:hypothetical protein
MATSTYLSLLKTVSAYVDEPKARQVIARQMAKCNATEVTLEVESLKNIAHMVAGAAGLYVADPKLRMELARKISVLAGL